MENQFFSKPIPNSVSGYPARHWELDDQGLPTQEVMVEATQALTGGLCRPPKTDGRSDGGYS